MISERKGPSRSEQTNELLALCQSVLDGSAGLEALGERVRAREEGLLKARADFVAQTQSQGERYLQKWAEPIQAVLNAFDEYGVALGGVKVYLGSPRPEILTGAMESLTKAADQLLNVLDQYDGLALIEGPTQYPVLNMLIHTSDSVRQGTFPKEEFARMMAETRSWCGLALKELETVPPDRPQAPVEQIRQGMRGTIEGIQEMERFLADGDAAHLDAGVEMVRAAHNVIHDGRESYRKEAYESGPTSSPIANTYLHAARLVKDGKFDRAMFAESLDRLDEHLANIRKGFENLCQVPTESVAIQEEIPKIMEAFDLHEEANAAWRRYLASNQPADLDEGSEKLAEAMRRLDESKAALDRLSQSEGKALCPKCFTPNEMGSRVCSSCGAPLPRVEHLGDGTSSFAMVEGGQLSEQDQEMVVTEHLKKIIEDTNAVAEGKISHEEFEATCAWMDGILDNAEQQLAATPYINPESFPEDQREQARNEAGMLEDTKELLREGIQNTRYGLQQLRSFMVDGDQQHLIDGLRTVWDASRQVLQVQRIGEIAARSIVDEGPAEPAPLATTRLDEDEVQIDKMEG